MLKGDIRKQEIVQTAEMLFCKKGYVESSVQDILDILHLSKGSFYHHFASKELLLEAICQKRAYSIREAVIPTLDKQQDTTQKLDLLLSGMIPLKGEKIRFLLMLLPVFDLPEGWNVKKCYCDALASSFRQDLQQLLEAGKREGVVYCEDVLFSTDLILMMVNELWCKICEMILKNEKSREETEASELLHLIEQFRKTIEILLSLRYGSLTLLNLSDIMAIIGQIHQHWNYA